MAITPVSKRMKSVTLPVARSILTVSLTLMAGSGYRILELHQLCLLFSDHSLAQRLIDTGDLRASIMRNQVWDSSFAHLHSLHLAEFVFCLGLFDAVDGETALGVVDETEMFASLVNRDHIHVARWVGDVCADLSINLDETLHHNRSGLAAVQRVLEAISEENDQGETIALFLGSSQQNSGICDKSRRT